MARSVAAKTGCINQTAIDRLKHVEATRVPDGSIGVRSQPTGDSGRFLTAFSVSENRNPQTPPPSNMD
jgi:hypothetical protein